jgi:hypothetical protein
MDTNKLTTSQLFLIVVIMMALISSMTSCTSTKVVYQKGEGWGPMSSKSTVTGWSYK